MRREAQIKRLTRQEKLALIEAREKAGAYLRFDLKAP